MAADKSRSTAPAVAALTFVLCLAYSSGPRAAETDDPQPGFIALTAEELAFATAADDGALKFRVIAGNPNQPGVYVLRVLFPPGVQSKPHFHDQDRHVTVIEGTWSFGTGAGGDCVGTKPLPRGSFGFHPAGAVHYDGACGDTRTIVEITGMGPVTTTPVAAAR